MSYNYNQTEGSLSYIIAFRHTFRFLYKIFTSLYSGRKHDLLSKQPTSLDKDCLVLCPGWVTSLPVDDPLPNEQLLGLLGGSPQGDGSAPPNQTTGYTVILLGRSLGVHVLSTDAIDVALGTHFVVELQQCRQELEFKKFYSPEMPTSNQVTV